MTAEKEVGITETEKIQEPKKEDELLQRIAELERRDEENQKKLKTLYEVADKGRLFNYENSKQEKKAAKIKLSVYGGNIIVGWRTVKDELIKDPRTGSVVGEEQQYEILLLDPAGTTTKQTILSYVNFSNARYNERIECEVVSKKEDYDGNFTFDVRVPDGRVVSLGGQFIN